MTACFKLVRTLQQRTRLAPETFCALCVYFSRNLDPAEYPVLMVREDACGLGFRPADDGCTEMRTDNCSTSKSRS